MKGYYNKPEATAEAIDADGWFHTGDIGLLDADGFLKITDRKKDIIVTAGGKNIAPQPIENRVKTNKFVSQRGDDRRQAQVPRHAGRAQPRQPARPGPCARTSPSPTTRSLIALPEAGDKIEREVKKALRDLAHFEMPKKVLLLARDFSIEGGELTPTLKVKRRVVERNYQAQIEALYSDKSGNSE